MAQVSQWNLDENAGTADVADSVGTDSANIVAGGTVTSDLYVGVGNGPGGDAEDAGFDFAVATDAVGALDSQSAAGLNNHCTFSLAFRCTDPSTTEYQTLIEMGGSAAGCGMYIGDDVVAMVRVVSSTPYVASVTCPTDGNWHHVMGYYSTTGTKVGIILDGGADSDEITNAALSSTAAGGNVGGIGDLIGTALPPSGGSSNFTPLVGSVAWVKLWDSDESANVLDEANEVGLGPKPSYTSGASLGSDGAYSVGTWDSNGNGSLSYVVSAVNAAGDVLESAVTSTGTLDLSGNSGNTCYLLVRASNDGGYDAGDYATRTSGFGSAGDGYYEVASVVAAGGGGGVSGAIDQTLPSLTQSASAAVTREGAASQALPALTQSLAASVTKQAAAAQAFPALTQSATATAGSTTAAIAQTLPAITQSSAAVVTRTAAAAQELPALSQSASAAVTRQAAIAQALPALAQSAQANSGETGAEVAQALPALTQSAAATVTRQGSIGQTLPALQQAMTAAITRRGAIAQTLPSVTQRAIVDGAVVTINSGILVEREAPIPIRRVVAPRPIRHVAAPIPLVHAEV